MNLISKLINEAAAGYESGDAKVRVSIRPGPAPSRPGAAPEIASTGQLKMPPTSAQATASAESQSKAGGKVHRADKPHFEVDLDWNTESNLYSGFTDEPVGVFVATHTRLAVGTVVDLDVALPDGRAFKTTGRVQWVQEPRNSDDTETVPGLGIEFTHVEARPSWSPPTPEIITPSMPPIRVMSIHPLKPDDAGALVDFGKARTPTFYDE